MSVFRKKYITFAVLVSLHNNCKQLPNNLVKTGNFKCSGLNGFNNFKHINISRSGHFKMHSRINPRRSVIYCTPV